MAQNKKTFKKDNPALSFISAPEETEAIENDSTLQIGSKLIAPEGYKVNPMYIETKSKRVQLLLQPSVVEAIKALAKKKGISMNEAVSEAIKEYLHKEQID